MKDVAFYRVGNHFVLKVRQSCQAAIAQSWLQQQGIKTSFKRVNYWYQAVLPESLPEPLKQALKKRASKRVPRRAAGPL